MDVDQVWCRDYIFNTAHLTNIIRVIKLRKMRWAGHKEVHTGL
jgi:hypothetical protein